MGLNLPTVIGHRGVAGYAPENTLEGIHTAADMGLKWVELDVKLTRDDVPILFHDETLERTTNGAGSVAETDYTEIQNLECGSWFSDSYAGIKIPSLEEALDVLIDRNLGLNLEIKACPGRERDTAEIALDLLSHIWDRHDDLLISSFSHVSMEAALDLCPDWHRGLLLVEEWPENWNDLIEYLNVSSVNINGKTCTREQVEQILDLDLSLAVLAYTVNDPERARLLRRWGVDSIFSDTPDRIEDVFVTH